jgi:hypothetical protein
MSEAHLAVIDMRTVFADPASEWFTPRFDEVVGPIGAWRRYHHRPHIEVVTVDEVLRCFD